MKNKKKFILFALALLVVSIITAVILAKTLNRDHRANTSSKNTHTLKFDYYSETELIHSISFIYSDKKLQDVVLTMYFDSKETAKNALKVYKAANEFKDYKVEKNRLLLYYFNDDMIDFRSLTEEEIIQKYLDDGYVRAK